MCILGRDVLLYASSSLDGASRTPAISTSSVSDVGILSEEHFQFSFNLKGLKETMQLGNVWQVSMAVVRGTAFQ